ncbi:MAG: hypothetical protein ACM3VV_07960 [Deltaproteobacteria bacterium]
MKIANTVFLFFAFSLIFLSPVYGISPKLNSELLNNKIEKIINYNPSGGYNKILNYSEIDINLDNVYVTSNGTHIEIKLLFDDLLDNLKKAILNNSTIASNFFINIFIDSDDDETTGFLGYNYRYFLSHNISDSYDDSNNLTIAKKNLSEDHIHNHALLHNYDFRQF